ncbi:drug/metabolite transporter (DMT)-like permease [Microbacterium halimionae]|uniref:Drug/metabolite transporter (DMT)-like permease n=1 Tax=Microbacterium halimionae TaxID=1526413 RepID=A0A7W3PMV0_9MICO|nr:DMT family transporter [Microbacterium halimionae]MBA8817573.1 drug/metabolite transporter (DMT)-like permease [Microbacterium halimionae]NII94283.1 drug/metabolite transporter (DMT)-like permease [Microbacterium halimionae]
MSKQIGILSGLLTVGASAAFVLTWSSGFLVAAIGTVDVAPTTLLVWRFVPIALVLLAVTFATGAFRGVRRDDIQSQVIIGFFAQFGYCACVYGSIAIGITTGTTALIDAVQPLVVATLVGPLLGLRVRGAQWIGLGVGAVGVVLVVQSQIGGSDAAPIAYLLPALAMVCLIAGTFVERRTQNQPPVLVTLTVHVTVTAVVLTAIAVATGTLVPPASVSFWVATAVAALSPTLAAYGLYWWLLRRIGVTALNALLFLVAPTTALAGSVLLGEPLTLLTLAGFVLCGAGVAVVLVSEARAARFRRATDDSGAHATNPHASNRQALSFHS